MAKKYSRSSRPVPHRTVDVLHTGGFETLEPSALDVERVGQKAYGLAALPTAWVPPFFVVDCSYSAQLSRDFSFYSIQLRQVVAECLGASGTTQIYIRSSGVVETLDYRGQLDSRACSVEDLPSTLVELHKELCSAPHSVHFIVQVCMRVHAKGHLSNERRFRREPRDWVAEWEPAGGNEGRTESVSIRPWRDGVASNIDQMFCIAPDAVGIALRRVAGWGFRFNVRLHFEWVWDGMTLWVVQVDLADDSIGTNPHSTIPAKIESLDSATLRVFRIATQSDFEKYRKLKNTRLYASLNYDINPFYVIDDAKAIESIFSGRISTNLDADLADLTLRPFIIRVDGTNIPAANRDMLPRSDELRSADDAKAWFVDKLVPFINKHDLKDCGICLIAHHFIPAVASAWARAQPDISTVRIESLWGIPEGLYWHSHDTFSVDTRSRVLDQSATTSEYEVRERIRYKGTFIAADSDGRWIPQATDAQHDWVRSIKKKEWISEIARTTRAIAESEGKPVAVMWFIDTHRQATQHRVLPWYHTISDLEDGPKAAPRRKHRSIHDVRIRTTVDWITLTEDVRLGKPIQRIIIEPIDAELIRNQSFAKELALLAKENGCIVELSGGVLSHAYYLLMSGGCRVECVDLFDATEEVVDFNKLVRDGIPDFIKGRGEQVIHVNLTGDTLVKALKQKLVEEAFEALDATSANDLLGELADVQEVLFALAQSLGIDGATLDQERQSKKRKRGGFDAGVMLLKTAASSSFTKRQMNGHSDDLLFAATEVDLASASASSRPVNSSTYRRPDFRNLTTSREKYLTFATSLQALAGLRMEFSFDAPVPKEGSNTFTLTFESERERSNIRCAIRLNIGATQLDLDLSH
ncbi:nucleoside triphosphate pyrophosphohydrolase [Schauerella aestuarii]|uniref:nucleoside triphosphate pyrophosphohydrolase n=1 Tax=Schauerella aestuarii TaxID=2511204 RepID=UPI001369789E|nr:nucleoside triphosphate pyrophosphohydrolase [Achromobacter aestuarii]MYZ45189.1 hypothetical protein [Achromobacter aestuarii]